MQKPGDLPGRCLQHSNASRKGVQAAVGFLSLQKRSRRQPVARAWQKGRRDFVF
jgi:hypothetical protein